MGLTKNKNKKKMLMEEDIKLLIQMDHWVSVVPHEKKWRGVIWREVDGEWKSHRSRVHNSPVECYEWAAGIIEVVHEKYKEKQYYE